jgi:hypothetical protein
MTPTTAFFLALLVLVAAVISWIEFPKGGGR